MDDHCRTPAGPPPACRCNRCAGGARMKIAMIGLGNMGSTIAPRLLAAGHLVSAWNRSRSAIDQLDGVHALASPAEAFQHEVVISLLANDQAVREVLIDTDALARCAAHTVHVVMSTLSIAMVKE